MSETVELPQFPLGSCLLPFGILPLQIFEPRYHEMFTAIADGDGRFGVTLIERGSEVGGGDARSSVGTVAQLQQYQRAEDGRILLVAVGDEVQDVAEWLPDDPYPRAVVTLRDPEPGPAPADAATILEDLRDQTAALLALVGGGEPEQVAAELAETLGTSPREASDVDRWIWSLGVVLPWGAYDRQRLLRATGRSARLAILVEEIPGLLAVARATG